MTTTPIPPATPSHPNESSYVLRIELIISYLLRIGVIASLAIVITGMFLTFRHHPEYFHSPDAVQRLKHDNYEREPDFPHTVPMVFESVRGGRGKGVVLLGLLLLVATPFAPVALSAVVFLLNHDKKYAFIAITVLVLLLLSFALGGESRRPAKVSPATQPAAGPNNPAK